MFYRELFPLRSLSKKEKNNGSEISFPMLGKPNHKKIPTFFHMKHLSVVLVINRQKWRYYIKKWRERQISRYINIILRFSKFHNILAKPQFLSNCFSNSLEEEKFLWNPKKLSFAHLCVHPSINPPPPSSPINNQINPFMALI